CSIPRGTTGFSKGRSSKIHVRGVWRRSIHIPLMVWKHLCQGFSFHVCRGLIHSRNFHSRLFLGHHPPQPVGQTCWKQPSWCTGTSPPLQALLVCTSSVHPQGLLMDHQKRRTCLPSGVTICWMKFRVPCSLSTPRLIAADNSTA
ncbi:unnamed protein product, partial [Staurois parvus]